jgi:hypothetical protein
VQVDAPTNPNERRCSAAEEPSDHTGKNVAGSRGGETHIPFAADYLLVWRPSNNCARALECHYHLQFNGYAACDANCIRFDLAPFQTYQSGHLSRMRCDDNSALMTVKQMPRLVQVRNRAGIKNERRPGHHFLQHSRRQFSNSILILHPRTDQNGISALKKRRQVLNSGRIETAVGRFA